jgi:hypothetical protein
MSVTDKAVYLINVAYLNSANGASQSVFSTCPTFWNLLSSDQSLTEGVTNEPSNSVWMTILGEADT